MCFYGSVRRSFWSNFVGIQGLRNIICWVLGCIIKPMARWQIVDQLGNHQDLFACVARSDKIKKRTELDQNLLYLAHSTEENWVIPQSTLPVTRIITNQLHYIREYCQRMPSIHAIRSGYTRGWIYN